MLTRGATTRPPPACPGFNSSCSLPLGNVNVPFSVPAANNLPHTMAGRDFLLLMQSLDAGNLLMLWGLLLTEAKVVLQARQPHVLTMAAETLSALLFPFSWEHVYIPILPGRLLDILQAPVPFLIGIDDEVLAVAERTLAGGIPDEVVQVDLDKNEVLCAPDVAKTVVLPQKQYYKLYKALAPYCRAPNAEEQQGGNAASAFTMAPPPDVDLADRAPTLAEMSDEAVAEAIGSIKAAFLRFFVSLMARYQDLMVVPPAEIKQPAAVDFFDVRRWVSRFPSPSHEWLQLFVDGQAFTQWLEQRLAPRQTPELEVVFFNESIDAKLMRSAKTKLLTLPGGKASTPLLSTGAMPRGGYAAPLVPSQVRTVYNASMIAARPVRAQQQVALLVVMGSGMHEGDRAAVADFEASLKAEFASNLLWSRVDIGAALRTHACAWRSAAAQHHSPLRAHGLENVDVRHALLDAVLYADPDYRASLHDAMRGALAALAAADGGADGGTLPLCVVAHGFGSVVAIDFFAQLHTTLDDDGGGGAPPVAPPVAPPPPLTSSARKASSRSSRKESAPLAGSTPLERGQTLAYFCTLGSPRPLVVGPPGAAGGGGPSGPTVPTAYMTGKWPHLRGGWSNYFHRGDLAGYPLQPSISQVTEDVECKQRHAKGESHSAQNAYLHDLVDCVRPIAQALSWVWQDTNQKPSAQKWEE